MILPYLSDKIHYSQKLKNDSLVLPTSGTIKNGLRYLNNRYSLPETISQQINDSLPWKFAISDKGCMLAILQENIIEIRKSKDEYSSVIGKATGTKFFYLLRLRPSFNYTFFKIFSTKRCFSTVAQACLESR